MRLFNKTLIVIGFFATIYILGIFMFRVLINSGITNAESISETSKITGLEKIPAEMWQVHKYIAEHPRDAYDILEAYIYLNGTGGNTERWPKNNGGIDFVVNGTETRKAFANSVNSRSEKLGIDRDLVMACVLGEQIRIANKGARGDLKNIVIGMTPRLLRSYNVSLGIGGIKFETAQKIREDGCKYWHADQSSNRDGICNDVITSSGLADNDAFNAKYATYLVFNIVERRRRAGYEIEDKPGIVCSLYNMGNPKEKEPHKDPKMGGAIINVNGKKFSYGGLSMGAYRYLKIFTK